VGELSVPSGLRSLTKTRDDDLALGQRRRVSAPEQGRARRVLLQYLRTGIARALCSTFGAAGKVPTPGNERRIRDGSSWQFMSRVPTPKNYSDALNRSGRPTRGAASVLRPAGTAAVGSDDVGDCDSRRNPSDDPPRDRVVPEDEVQVAAFTSSSDDETNRWIRELGADGAVRDRAVERLHELLLRVSYAEVRRRSARPPVAGPELDDLAYQAANDALLVADRFGIGPEDLALRSESIGAVRRAVEEQVSDHQRRVFMAIVVERVPAEALATTLGSNRNAIYKTIFGARRKLRAALVAKGYLDDRSRQCSRLRPLSMTRMNANCHTG
jgi:RNA polymerase sigma-70 factor, ECF subfamily